MAVNKKSLVSNSTSKPKPRAKAVNSANAAKLVSASKMATTLATLKTSKLF